MALDDTLGGPVDPGAVADSLYQQAYPDMQGPVDPGVVADRINRKILGRVAARQKPQDLSAYGEDYTPKDLSKYGTDLEDTERAKEAPHTGQLTVGQTPESMPAAKSLKPALEMPGPIEAGRRGAVRAGEEFGKLSEFGQPGATALPESTKLFEKPPEEQPPTFSELIDPRQWGNLASKVSYGLAKGAPAMAGGIGGALVGGPAGSAAGAGTVTVVQSLGNEYAKALQENGGDRQAAIKTAIRRAGLEGVISAGSFAAFGWNPFDNAIKDVALQALAVQPAIDVAGHVATNVSENVAAGRPAFDRAGEGATEGVPGTIAGTIIPAALLHWIHAGARGRPPEPPPEMSPADRAAWTRTASEARMAAERGLPGPDAGAPGQGPEEASGSRPGEPPPGAGPGPGGATAEPPPGEGHFARATMEEILRYYGHSDADLKAMSLDELKEAVRQATQTGANRSSTGAEHVADMPANEVSDLLRRFGYSDSDLSGMALDTRRSTLAQHIDSYGDPRKPGWEPPTAKGEAGTRDNPIVLHTPADVQRATSLIDEAHSHAQAEANNTQRVHATWNGMGLAFEARAGGPRRGVSPAGLPFETIMGAHSGYIKGVPPAADGMAPDFYMGEHPGSPNVWVIDEKARDTGQYRQSKSFLGFQNMQDALNAYLRTSTKTPDQLGGMRVFPAAEFKQFAESGGLSKPVSEKMSGTAAESSHPAPEAAAPAPAGAPQGAPATAPEPTTAGPRAPKPAAPAAEPEQPFRGTPDEAMAGLAELFGGPKAGPQAEPTTAGPRTPETPAEATAQHHAEVEHMLSTSGVDPSEVRPVDVARAAEIMAEEDRQAPDAYQIAMVRGLVEAGTLTPEQVKELYGPDKAAAILGTAGASTRGVRTEAPGAATGGEVAAAESDQESPGGGKGGAGGQAEGVPPTEATPAGGPVQHEKPAGAEAGGGERTTAGPRDPAAGTAAGEPTAGGPRAPGPRPEAATEPEHPAPERPGAEPAGQPEAPGTAEDLRKNIADTIGFPADHILSGDLGRALELMRENSGMTPLDAIEQAAIEQMRAEGLLSNAELETYGYAQTEPTERPGEVAAPEGGKSPEGEPAGVPQEGGPVERPGEKPGPGGKPAGESGGVQPEPTTAGPRGTGAGQPGPGAAGGGERPAEPGPVAQPEPTTGGPRAPGDGKKGGKKAEAKPEEPEEPKQPEGLQDWGEKIGGARKDTWSGRGGLTGKDLGDMNDAEKKKYVTKENVWPRPDYAAMVEGGVDAKAAYLIKRVYDRLATSPWGRPDQGYLLGWIDAMKIVRRAAEEAKTAEDVQGIAQKVRDAMTQDVDGRKVWDSTKEYSIHQARSRANPLNITYDDRRAAEREVKDGWPSKEGWQRIYQVQDRTRWADRDNGYPEFKAQALEKFKEAGIATSESSSGRFHPDAVTLHKWGSQGKEPIDPATLSPELKQVWDGLQAKNLAYHGGQKYWTLHRRKTGARHNDVEYPSLTEAEVAAKAAYEAGLQEGGGGKELPVRPHLDHIERTGPNYRGGRNVAEKDFDEFGFRAGEFGNWAANDERQTIANHAFDAFHDLARVLGVPPRAMSLNGTLALAFGSRGKGGRMAAMAHYEPLRKVFNFTKEHGAGTVAHEWTHALDHYFGSALKETGERHLDALGMASGGRGRAAGYVPTNLNPKLGKAFKDAIQALISKTESDQEAQKRIDARIDGQQQNLKGWQQAVVRYRKSAAAGEWTQHKAEREIAKAQGYIQQLQDGVAKLRAQRATAKGSIKKDTDYFGQAQRLGPYWARPEELLARAFEAYVFDKIAAEPGILGKGYKSQYLVHGVEDSRFSKHPAGNPYPTGEERQAFNRAFDTLLAQLTTIEGPKGPQIVGRRGAVEPDTELTSELPQPVGEAGYSRVLIDPELRVSLDNVRQELASHQVTPNEIAEHFLNELRGGARYENILVARRSVEKFTKDPKVVEEALEHAVVLRAREIIDEGQAIEDPPIVTYEALRSLYDAQPRLSTRTSTSTREQAYSTPIPLAYVASRLAHVSRETSVYEPAAGNGALLIEANPKKVIANEINGARAGNLRSMGFENVSNRDAIGKRPDEVDRVLANPPFGSVLEEGGQSRVFDLSATQPGYRTTQIDHAIALEALKALKDDGKAVLLLGSINKLADSPERRFDAYNTKEKREFYKALYDHYQVVDHFTVDGDLYSKQGAAWPIDVVVIDGRGKSERGLPAVNLPVVLKTWDDVGRMLDGRSTEAIPGEQAAPAPQPGAGGGAGGRHGGGGRLPPRGGPVTGGPPVEGPEGMEQGGGKPPIESESGAGETGVVRGERAGPGGESVPGGRASGVESPKPFNFRDSFNGALDDIFGKEPQEPAAQPDTRTTTQVAVDAAKNAGSAADQAMAGLAELFGATPKAGKLHVWVAPEGWDEATWKRAKPMFEQAANKFAAFKDDLNELVRRMVADLVKTFGLGREAVARMMDYLDRFIHDVRDGLIKLVGGDKETIHQVRYKPESEMTGLGTVAPIHTEAATTRSLKALVRRVGKPIDEYVAEELGYAHKNELDPKGTGSPYGAEQVDALGLAIENAKNGRGFINGDMTGVGKGRFLAGMIRWAHKNGKIPIFVTREPNLYKDLYRDLSDTGFQAYLGREPRLAMTNEGSTVSLNDDGSIKLTTKKGWNDKLAELTPENFREQYDVLLTTYSQLQTVKGAETQRRSLLKRLTPQSVFVFDESHSAGGQGAGQRTAAGVAPGRAQLVRSLIDDSMNNGTVYASATYAKRPDVMDLYRATDMRLAIHGGPNELADLYQRGGIPLQEVTASMLAEGGQYIRRERSYDGIRYEPQLVKTDQSHYQDFSRGLRQIQNFSLHVQSLIRRIKQQLAAQGQAVLPGGQAVGEGGADSTNFTSVMHNLIDNYLLATKIEPAIQEAIQSIEAGEKPVLTVAKTMGALLDNLVEAIGKPGPDGKSIPLQKGDPIEADFGAALQRFLERSREITIDKGFGKKERYRLTDEDLGPAGVALYDKARTHIANANFGDLPISPIDYTRFRLSEKGHRIGEITGRSNIVEYSRGEGGKLVMKYATRPAGEHTIDGKNRSISRFNAHPDQNGLHALILNQAGSTGLSIHASRTFSDQRPRHMIIVQPEANIDTHMQLLGRVNRTGQVTFPRYTQLVADVAAEKRPAAVLLKKMASLNANTTGARASALTAETREIPDFMNEYGDETAAQYVEDHPEVNQWLGTPVKSSLTTGKAERPEAMRKLTGRIPMLEPHLQDQLYQDLEDRYRDYIDELTQAGENALEAQHMDFQSKRVESYEVVPPVSTQHYSPFAGSAKIEKLDVKRLGKPLSTLELGQELAPEIGANLKAITKDNAARFLRNLEGSGPIRAIEGIDEASAAKVRETAQARQELFDKALKEFDVYKRSVLDEIDDVTAQAARRVQLDAMKDHWNDIRAMLKPGARIDVRTSNGNLTAITLRVRRSGKAKNPLSPSNWTADFAVADATRRQKFTFTRLFEVGKADPNSARAIELKPLDYLEQHSATLDRFESQQGEVREDRHILTGNLVAGYDWLDKNGQFVHFTDADQGGAVRQGILTPRGWNFEEYYAGREQPVSDLNEILKHLRDGTTLTSRDKAIDLEPGYNGDSLRIYIRTARGLDGRKYYTDKALTGITGDFYKRGQSYQARLADRGEMARAIKRLQELGAVFGAPARPLEPEKNYGPKGKRRARIEDAEDWGPRIVSSKKMQEAVLRNEWARHGADLDYEEFWDKHPGVWEREVAAWNKAHHTNIDAENTKFDSSTKGFTDYFEKTYLDGKKAAFPGVEEANYFFEDNGEPERGAYLSADEAPQARLESQGRLEPKEYLAPRALEKRAQLENGLTDLLRSILGKQIVDVKFRDSIPINPDDIEGWGRMATGEVTAAGLFTPADRLIEIALGPRPDGSERSARDLKASVRHEAYHAAKDLVMTPDERAFMDGQTERMRKDWLRGLAPEADIKGMNQEEVQAEAFAQWNDARDRGQDLGRGLHIGVRKLFNNIRAFWERIRNWLADQGFRTYEDVFSDLRRGAFKDRESNELGRALRHDDLVQEWANRYGWDEAQARDVLNQVREEAAKSRARIDLGFRRARDRIAARLGSETAVRLREGLSDYNERVRLLQNDVESLYRRWVDEDGNLPDQKQFYTLKRLFPGKVATRADVLAKKHLWPLDKFLRQHGLKREAADDYLAALHAEERNAAIGALYPATHPFNRAMRDPSVAGGSGWSAQEARDVLRTALAGPHGAVLPELRQRIEALRDFIQGEMIRGGLESRATIEAWNRQYRDYVPLRGWEDPDEEPLTADMRSGRGSAGVVGPETPRAFGRTTKADSPLANLIAQAYRTIDRAEKNLALNSLAEAVAGLPAEAREGLVRLNRPKLKPVVDRNTGLVRYVSDYAERFKPNAVAFKRNGAQRYLYFEDPQIAEAVKRWGAYSNRAIQPILWLTNKLKSIWTHYSPDFQARHQMRYFIEGLENSFELKETGRHSASRYAKDAFPIIGAAARAIWAVEHGRDGGALGAHYQEMKKHGGWMAMRTMRDIDQIKEDFRVLTSNLGKSNINPLRAWRNAAEAINRTTSMWDNAQRLATYAQAREQGMTAQQAALKARDATIDYQMRGLWSNMLGLIEPFFNTALRTGFRLGGALNRSKVMRGVFFGTLAMGLAASAFNYFVGGNDTDGTPFFDKIPEWEKRLNLMILAPWLADEKGRPQAIKLPMPYNWAFPLTLGYTMGNWMWGKGSPWEAWKMLARSFLSTFTQVSEESGGGFLSLRSFVPELVRPSYDVAINRNWYGAPVHTEHQQGPAAWSGKQNTGEGWKDVAQFLNSASGGSRRKSGIFDFYPEDYREILNPYLGTHLRLGGEVYHTGAALAQGQAPSPKQVPIGHIFFGSDYDAADRAARAEKARAAKQPWAH